MVTAPPKTAVDDIPPPLLFAAFRQIAPKGRKCRADAGLQHVYDSTISWAQIAARAPQVPFAVPLASRKTGRFSLLCFDLDVHQNGLGPDGVDVDTEVLLELLAALGIPYLVVQSSKGGGRHVWIALRGDGAEAEDVAELARALEQMLLTLDITMLCNPRTGCVRPPGAAHRNGGRAKIDTFYHPNPHAALAAFVDGTDPEAVGRLLDALPEDVRTPKGLGPVDRAWTVDSKGRPKLAIPRRDLSEKVAAAANEEIRAGEDASGRLRSIAMGALNAGWEFDEFATLCATAPGALHARAYFRSGYTVRSPRKDQDGFLLTQWERAFKRVQSTLPPAGGDRGEETYGGEHPESFDDRSARIVRGVQGLLEQVQADPRRWGGHAGPGDYKILVALMGRAVRGLTLRVGASVRALAEEAGVCPTTASQALRRLARVSQVGRPAWITLSKEAAGTRSAVWRLLVPEGPDAPAHQAEYLSEDITRTQGTPTPSPARAKRALVAALEGLSKLSWHDCWNPGRGLGHGASHTYTAIRTQKDPRKRLKVTSLCDLTGFNWQTTLLHLRKLASVGLVVLGRLKDGTRTVRATARSLDAVARELGVSGITAARIERHRIDRLTFEWWQAELEWRTRPLALNEHLKKHVKWGVPETISDDPDLRPDDLADRADADIRWKFGRFPTRPDGRMDWAAARAIVAAA